jgi:hypothetical protein
VRGAVVSFCWEGGAGRASACVLGLDGLSDGISSGVGCAAPHPPALRVSSFCPTLRWFFFSLPHHLLYCNLKSIIYFYQRCCTFTLRFCAFFFFFFLCRWTLDVVYVSGGRWTFYLLWFYSDIFCIFSCSDMARMVEPLFSVVGRVPDMFRFAAGQFSRTLIPGSGCVFCVATFCLLLPLPHRICLRCPHLAAFRVPSSAVTFFHFPTAIDCWWTYRRIAVCVPGVLPFTDCVIVLYLWQACHARWATTAAGVAPRLAVERTTVTVVADTFTLVTV